MTKQTTRDSTDGGAGNPVLILWRLSMGNRYVVTDLTGCTSPYRIDADYLGIPDATIRVGTGIGNIRRTRNTGSTRWRAGVAGGR